MILYWLIAIVTWPFLMALTVKYVIPMEEDEDTDMKVIGWFLAVLAGGLTAFMWPISLLCLGSVLVARKILAAISGDSRSDDV